MGAIEGAGATAAFFAGAVLAAAFFAGAFFAGAFLAAAFFAGAFLAAFFAGAFFAAFFAGAFLAAFFAVFFAAFFAGAFFAVFFAAFLAGDFLAAAFLAGDFLAADFLAGAFLAAIFFAGAFLAAFFAVAITFLLDQVDMEPRKTSWNRAAIHRPKLPRRGARYDESGGRPATRQGRCIIPANLDLSSPSALADEQLPSRCTTAVGLWSFADFTGGGTASPA